MSCVFYTRGCAREQRYPTVWVRVWPGGTHHGQSLSQDHRAGPQGEGRSEGKPGSQANAECSQAVLPHICHRLLNVKPLKNILSIIFRIILVFILFITP